MAGEAYSPKEAVYQGIKTVNVPTFIIYLLRNCNLLGLLGKEQQIKEELLI